VGIRDGNADPVACGAADHADSNPNADLYANTDFQADANPNANPKPYADPQADANPTGVAAAALCHFGRRRRGI